MHFERNRELYEYKRRAIPTKLTYATLPLPGIQLALMDENGQSSAI